MAHVRAKYPNNLLLAAGWSLGANILTRYLGEEGEGTPISAAAALCNPFNLVGALPAGRFDLLPRGGHAHPCCSCAAQPLQPGGGCLPACGAEGRVRALEAAAHCDRLQNSLVPATFAYAVAFD